MTVEDELRQIGTVAERVGLSVRTFRLYTDSDIDRLRQIKGMKPLGFTLDETRDLMALRDRLTDGASLTADEKKRLEHFTRRAEERCAELEAQLAEVQATTSALRADLEARLPVIWPREHQQR
jgi:DNA-binding transcriptional MerR regulator